MKIRDITIRAGRSLKQAKARTILTSLAIAVGSFTIVLSLAVGAGGRAYTTDIISSNTNPRELYVQPKQDVGALFGTGKPKKYSTNQASISDSGGFKLLRQSDIDKISAVSGIESATPYYLLNPKYITREGQDKYIITSEAFNSSIKLEYLAGNANSIKAGVVIINDDYREVLGFKNAKDAIGGHVQIAIEKGNSNPLSPEIKLFDFMIGGVIKKSSLLVSAGVAGVNIYKDDAKMMFDYSRFGTARAGTYAAVVVRVKDGADVNKVRDEIKSAGYDAKTAEDLMSVIFQFVNVLQGILVGFGVLAVLTSVFGIINTQYISVLERTQQIGLMKALGMRRRDVGRLFRLEATWIGFLGGATGSVLAIIFGIVANPIISKALGIGDIKLLIFEPFSIVVVVLGLMLVAVTSGILPARKAAKLNPIDALRTE